VPTAACGSPAFGQYRQGGRQPWALIVLEMAGDRIAAMTYFLDTATLFPLFGLLPELPVRFFPGTDDFAPSRGSNHQIHS